MTQRNQDLERAFQEPFLTGELEVSEGYAVPPGTLDLEEAIAALQEYERTQQPQPQEDE